MAKCLDLVIVGGGVAGLQAAATAAELGVTATVLEQLAPGGRVASLNDLYEAPSDGTRLGHELAAAMFEAAVNAGAEVLFDTAVALESGTAEITVQAAATVLRSRTAIVATGCTVKPLGVADEEQMYGRGLSTCATCDGPLYRGMDVTVVGGGDSAALEALEVARFADHVLVAFKEAEPHCEPELRDQLLANDKIELVPWATVVGLVTTAGRLSAVRLDIAGHPVEVRSAGIFCCAGLAPASELVNGQLKDAEGYLLTGQQTAVDSRLFAAGDVAAKTAKSVRAAIESGRQSALAAVARLAHEN